MKELILIPAMGWLSRMCGGGPPKLKFGLDQIIYAIPFAFNSYKLLSPSGWVEYGLVALTWLGAFLGKRTGHGGGMDVSRSWKEPGKGKGRSAETLEFFIRWAHNNIPRYWYDTILLSITGFAVTLVSSTLHFYYGTITDGLIMASSGLAKGPAYIVGDWLERREIRKGHVELIDGKHIMTRYPKYLNEPTAIGEVLTGVFNAIGLTLTM